MKDAGLRGGRVFLRRASSAVRVMVHLPHLLRTGLVAFIVGTWLTAVNLADVLFIGPPTTTLFFKVAMNYLTPFLVANLGLLSRR